LKCVEKIVWPSTLTKFDTLNASVGRCRTSARNITTATTAAPATTTWVWFFGFLDNSGQIYRNGFAWFSVARTQNVIETATSSLIEYATTVNATIGGIAVVIESSHH
jgi:hypothetical protein